MAMQENTAITIFYVERYNRFDTHNGGFGDISEPFETELSARQYAEAQAFNCIALYRVKDNRFEPIDDFTARDTDERPRGWHADITPEQIERHQQSVRVAYQQQQHDLEHSGIPVIFWVLTDSGSFAHGQYDTRAAAEAVIQRIRRVHPDAQPIIDLSPGGAVGMRFFPYTDSDGNAIR